MARYATVEELKGHVRIDDAIDDTQLTIALDAAEQAVDDYCQRGADGHPQPFVTPDTEDPDDKTTRLYVPSSNYPQTLRIDDLVELDVLERQTSAGGDWTEIDGDDFELHPLNVNGRPHTQVLFTTRHTVHRFRISGWFGWPTIPDTVKQATLLQAARFAQRRNASFGIATLSDMDGTGMRLLSKLDADVELMLNPLRRHQVLVA